MTIEDITGHIKAKHCNTAMQDIAKVIDKYEFSRAEILGMLDLIKMNLYTVWQVQDLMEAEDDD